MHPVFTYYYCHWENKQSITIFFCFNLRVYKLCNCGGNNNGDKYDKDRLTNETGNQATLYNNYIKGAVEYAVRRGRSRGV